MLEKIANVGAAVSMIAATILLAIILFKDGTQSIDLFTAVLLASFLPTFWLSDLPRMIRDWKNM